MTGSNAEGSSTTTRIRGNNSITADNKPLVILDGIPFDAPRASWANPRSVYDADMTVRNNFFPVKFLILLLFVRFDRAGR